MAVSRAAERRTWLGMLRCVRNESVQGLELDALDLRELQLNSALQGVGRIFINDAFKGRAWAFTCSGKNKGIEKLSFEGKAIYFEFEG
jgi:hypothetical protein